MNQSSGNGGSSVSSRAAYLELSALVAVSLAVWWGPIRSTFSLALGSDAHTHILLVLPLSIALIYFGPNRLPATTSSGQWIGAVLLTTALIVRGFMAFKVGNLSTSNSLSLNIFALVVWWIGSVVLIFGLPTFRVLLFPLCFLFLVVPLPEHLLNWITESLQHQSAIAAEILFRIARVPVTRDGVMLSIPDLDIEVARECSSIRSSTMLIVCTLVLARLFLRSPWRRILLILAAIPVSVAKNAVRIFTIAELGTRVDPGYLNGRLHHNGGIIFLGLGLIVIMLLLWGLRKREFRALSASS